METSNNIPLLSEVFEAHKRGEFKIPEEPEHNWFKAYPSDQHRNEGKVWFFNYRDFEELVKLGDEMDRKRDEMIWKHFKRDQ